MELMELTATIAGWMGALFTVTAYALVSLKRLDADMPIFHLMNMMGGALLAFSSATSGAWPSTTVNVIWLLIGAQALISAQFFSLPSLRRLGMFLIGRRLQQVEVPTATVIDSTTISVDVVPEASALPAP